MNDLENLKIMVQSLLAREVPTQHRIREIIDKVRPVCPGVSDSEAEDLALELESIHGVRMTEGAALKAIDFEPWLDAARAEIDFHYWERYRHLLAEKGFSSQVLGGLGNVTDKITGLLENPSKIGSWDRRGMVMGHVQSGKTANYIGVVAKAADAGYRVIIIIAGLQNKLRDQTQWRVDEGFIGFSSTAGKLQQPLQHSVLGVGKYDPSRRPVAFTTTNRDFHKGIAESLNMPLRNLTEPAVFVIKKNTNTLRNLIDWLKTHNAHLGTETITEPMLLVDDEADNASINIRYGMDEVSRINGQIRELLNLFDRSCYVGYTATPFANIFIDPETEDEMAGHDLFPRDFIVSLDAPTNYFGPSRVFGGNADVIRNVDDHGDLLPMSHKIDHQVTSLPPSLNEAVRVFLLARAIRLARRQTTAHNSMLVNVSRFVAVQRQIRNEIQSFIEQVSASVRVNGALPPDVAVRDPEIAELKRLFLKHYAKSYGHSWHEILGLMRKSVGAVSVVEVNSKSAGALNYVDHEASGLNVITVGGFALSRGLTLEGLTVSYFLRRSMMYDTLLQMGRWFGYRDGYEDLCRVWMPEEAQGWYEHVSESVDELREELARMQSANATPTEFGLKVRSHPDTLLVTAGNKMGTGRDHTVLIGLANHFVETAILRRDEEARRANVRAVVRLADAMQANGMAPKNGEATKFGRLVRDVPVKLVDEFVAAFKNHPGSYATEGEPVRKYIADRSATELAIWDVLFAGLDKSTKRSLVFDRVGFRLVCQRRAEAQRTRGEHSVLMVTNKQRVSSRGISQVGLTEAEKRAAEEAYESEHAENAGKAMNYPDRIYTRARIKPLLVVHLLAIGDRNEDLSGTQPFAAWSISFPSTELPEKRVAYVVNTTWYKEYFGEDEMGDEDLEDEN